MTFLPRKRFLRYLVISALCLRLCFASYARMPTSSPNHPGRSVRGRWRHIDSTRAFPESSRAGNPVDHESRARAASGAFHPGQSRRKRCHVRRVNEAKSWRWEGRFILQSATSRPNRSRQQKNVERGGLRPPLTARLDAPPPRSRAASSTCPRPCVLRAGHRPRPTSSADAADASATDLLDFVE